MSSLISTTAPLLGNGTYTSNGYQITRAESITGTIFADQVGTCYVDQGGDGVHWDYPTAIAVPKNVGAAIDVPLVDQWFRVRYVNGASAQTILRLFADPRDPYGAFLTPAQAPSAGGAFAILQFQPGPGTYTYLGRFDGLDGWDAISNAAISRNQNGKYAAFVVANAIVSDETISRMTEHASDSF